jgi:hypothetical protein
MDAGEAVRLIDEALLHLRSNQDAATAAADGAIEAERALEKAYYRGMAALLQVEDRTERIPRRELYRRCARIGTTSSTSPSESCTPSSSRSNPQADLTPKQI